MFNLIELLKASGAAGINGQTFRYNAAGAPLANGIRVTNFRCTGMSFTGQPVAGPTYDGNTLFSVVATPTADAPFLGIQRNDSEAWGLFTSTLGASVSLESFSAASGVHYLGVRVLSPITASPTASAVATLEGSQPPGSDPWPVRFTANIDNLGGAGSDSITISWTYDPDNAAFNQVLTNAWTGTFNNRGYAQDVDFDFQWRSAQSTGTTDEGPGVNGALLSTQRTFVMSGDVNHYVYPTNNEGLIPGESATAYLRWRVKPSSGGSGVWNNYATAVWVNDGRPGQ